MHSYSRKSLSTTDTTSELLLQSTYVFQCRYDSSGAARVLQHAARLKRRLASLARQRTLEYCLGISTAVAARTLTERLQPDGGARVFQHAGNALQLRPCTLPNSAHCGISAIAATFLCAQ